MKICSSLLTATTLVLAATAAAEGASPTFDMLSNATANSTAQALESRAAKDCTPPATSVIKWSYLIKSTYLTKPLPMKTCDPRKEVAPWTMLNAYRTGGDKDFTWRYVKDDDDFSDCLKDWTYYDKDGTSVIAKIEGYATTIGDKKGKSWCPLAVYRKGGVRGHQWDFCTCV